MAPQDTHGRAKKNEMVTRKKQNIIPPDYGRRISVVLVGDSGCGKTALSLASISKSPKHTTPTIGSDSFIRSFQNSRKQEVRINMWDLSGDDAYALIRQEFYKESHAIILCYDVSDRSSFESMDKWMNEATRFGDTKMIALGLKIDKPRAVNEQQAKTWASTKGLMYLEVSAFENKKIDDLWRRVIDI